ncbi:hypothetical protein DDB_G0284017 [Dictyostelium discoideum AX4]|uniref:Probable ATP-dependent RNA helicase ddx10 n=1 Tax=Dictyostelium discoideum TaxID=44689 RepID=DDX10_DICDI|nr:hypothetical protein DDB_G0284017 [Dictyostelium discoideum AX4]Q54Q94.1 RecName: Full=Probable ATP-dependent RNA helicase ddx10; AltName: Full=DEAD box protein 10 [Dictyostelium discoideum]EAL65432.1 hypothetical protein DDB_G0284017 [Dictyostelium discoideum AX4]|eukprot:XP_638786.1 hypothetical protein DDB_G0284017 [Dictyostelium discoideum AX4]
MNKDKSKQKPQKKENNNNNNKNNNNNNNKTENNKTNKDFTKNKFDKDAKIDKVDNKKIFHNRSSQKRIAKLKKIELQKKPLTLKLNEIKSIEQRLIDEAPQRGTNPLANISSTTATTTTTTATKNDKEKEKEYKIDYPSATDFKDLPISQLTLKALTESKFLKLTDIQRASLPHTLCGRDILGAAKTGSGKTLSFILPILETLWRNRWGRDDGIGAIVLSPTRELAIQIFDVLKAVGKYHTFSAGLIIGGRNVQQEKDKINAMNILIATPGRLLQHMDETYGFDCSNLKILVLDEADRILDLGFSKCLNSIVENLPRERQTLLFSATQTKSIRDLARLSLQEPEYISVYEKDITTTPQNLTQTLCVIPLEMKLNMLFSFIKTHLTSKIIVFFASCKQVRFAHETFKLLNPGTTLFPLHGKMKQWTRLEVFEDFCKKKAGTLFATDIAARGLDFPAVEWVIQVDCPDDIETYIHRVGRTARNDAPGQSITILLPSEKDGMVNLMEKQKMKFEILEPNPEKLVSIDSKLSSFLSEKTDLKYLAQKSFVSYLRSVYRQSNKEIFKIQELNINEFSKSLGLLGTPNIQFGKASADSKNKSFVVSNIQKQLKDKKSKGEKDIDSSDDDDDDEERNKIGNSDDEDSEDDSDFQDDSDDDNKKVTKQQPKTNIEKLFDRKNANVMSETYQKLRTKEEDEEDDSMFVVKRRDHDLDNLDIVKRLSRKENKEKNFINDPTKLKFQESTSVPKDGKLPTSYIEKVKSEVEKGDVQDKILLKERLKRKKLKLQSKELRKQSGGGATGDDEEESVAYFVPPGEKDPYENGENDSDDESNDDDVWGQEYNSDDDDDDEESESEEQPKPITKKRTLEDHEESALKFLKKNRI